MTSKVSAVRGLGVLSIVAVAGSLGCGARPPIDVDVAGTPSGQNTTTVTTGGAGGSGGAGGAGGATGGAGGSGSAGGAGGAVAAADAGTVPAPTDMAGLDGEVMARWNAAADGIATPGYDFHWLDFNRFPHPTYQHGTAEGYGDFSQVLLAFLQAGDNFDFLARNHLFGLQLHYYFPSGQDGLHDTLETLTDYFSSSTAFGNISDSTRAALAQLDAKMHQGS